MKFRKLQLLFFLLLAPLEISLAAPLPEACQTQCVSPYGQPLGADDTKVEAYSNCNAQCVVFEPNHQGGVYTGIKWQCVEYARRWLLADLGVVYGDVDVAADIWGLSEVRRVADNRKLPFLSYPNGAGQPPQVGDLLIYGREYLKTGHVAVVTKVDPEHGEVFVAEQNFLNQPWPADYARRLKLIKEDDRYWLLDSYLIGWKRVAATAP